MRLYRSRQRRSQIYVLGVNLQKMMQIVVINGVLQIGK